MMTAMNKSYSPQGISLFLIDRLLNIFSRKHDLNK